MAFRIKNCNCTNCNCDTCVCDGSVQCICKPEVSTCCCNK